MTAQPLAAPNPTVADLADRVAAWLEACGEPQLFSDLMAQFPEEHGHLLVRDGHTPLDAPVWYWGGVSVPLALALYRLQMDGRLVFPRVERAVYEGAGVTPSPYVMQLWTPATLALGAWQ